MQASKSYDFFSLKPPREAFFMKPQRCFLISCDHALFSPIAEDIRQEFEQPQKTRKIFCDPNYNEEEKRGIKEVKSLMCEGNESADMEIDDDLALKMLYSANFKHEKALERLKDFLSWKKAHDDLEVSTKMIELLDFSSSKKAIIYLLLIIEKYMLFPSVIEKWMVIMDCREFPKGFSFSPSDLLFLIEELVRYFPFRLEKLLMIEPTFEIVSFLKSLKDKIPAETLSHVHTLELKNMRSCLLKYIPANQLEQKFGGTITNKKAVWPPKTTFNDTNYSMSPSRESSSKDFLSARSSFSDLKPDHYAESVASNTLNDYFFDLQQKDYVYRAGEKFDRLDMEIQIDDRKAEDRGCFRPCFGWNKTTIIELQDEKKKNEAKCSIF